MGDPVYTATMHPAQQALTDLRRNVTRACAGVRASLLEKDDDRFAAQGYTLSVRELRKSTRVAVLPRGRFAAIIPGESAAEAVLTTGISSTLSLYQSALIIRVILTWFPSPPAAIVSPLATICDPYLNIFRGLIPPIGGSIDISPILAFVVLDLLTGSANSLSAEMPRGDKRDASDNQ